MSNLLLEKFHDIVDDRTGLLWFIEEMESFPDFPRFHHCAGIASDISAFTPHENSLPSGGASVSREAAIAKTIGEAVERYCSGLFEAALYPLTSYAEADFDCVAPEDFAINDPETIKRINSPWQPFTRDTVTRWAPMQNVTLNKEMYVPAAYVHVPYYYYTSDGDTPIVQPISTGLACHSTPEDATLNAINEVIERDAFMCMWQAKFSLPRIDVNTLPPDLKEIYDRFTIPGGKVTMFLSLQDHGIPTVICVYEHTAPTMPVFAFSAATSLNPGTAVRKSLEELAHTFRWIYALKLKNPDFDHGENFENVTDQERHLLCWGREQMRDKADFVFANKTEISFADIVNHEQDNAMNNIKRIVELVRNTNHQILLSDITSPDVEEIGLHVIRAVIPGYQPLAMGHNNRIVTSKRLMTLPQKLGYQPISPEVGDNPLPHPFP